ncbi:MAG: type II/IV secretion system protein [Parcubacteria group bacterium]|nr:type II/IV secretion system protein [Parcubacteria group bacterium]
MYVNSAQLKKFISDTGLVSLADIEAAEKKAKGTDSTFDEFLVREGKLTVDDIRQMKAYILGVPFINLRSEKIDPAVLSLIPEPIARNHNVVAFKKDAASIEVAMLDIDDLEAINFIKKKTGLKVLPRLTDTESMKMVLVQYQKSLKAEFGDIIQKEVEGLKMIPDGEEGDLTSEADLKKLAEDLPVVRIVDTLLNHAIIQGASDIHIEPMENQVLVRYRVDGILHDAMILPKTTASGITARIKVLANLKLDEKRLPQDGRFKIDASGQAVAFRVSILPTYYGEKTVMRLLREGGGGFSLEGLGFHGEALERIHHGQKQKTGMILTTGPTGSGKSTTLYTVLDLLNTPDVNISTIEDPVEYQMARVNQSQVRADIGFTFSEGLRTLVRQDPDIVMVGEIRDHETASLAVNAALTGHLVLSALHTNSAAGAMPRLIDMGVEPFLIISTVNVVIGQRLVRRLCGKEKYFLTKSEVSSLGKSIDLDRVLSFLKEEKVVKEDADDWEKIPFYKPKQTAECENGYGGRLVIHEVLKMTSTLKELIIKGASSDEIEKQAKKEGMMSMIEDGLFKAVQGMTTVEEVLRVISE